ncbi:hypothetical protein AJ87_24070 [Rhizobium yanglingense]|nr:hypothetical protein AJ87_24070 [Rhizobium yanglingense]
MGQAGWSAAEKVAGASWTYLLSHQPQIAAEIEGIAAGAGFSPLEIYCLNGFEFFDEPAATGCSSVAVSTSAGAVVGQNWDGPVGTEEQLVLISHCERGLQYTMVTSPGTLGWVGFNSCGFGFVTNDLMLDRSATGIPSLVARRLIIRQRRVGDAIAVLRSIDHMGGRCYLFGDETGAVAGVEISPKAGVVSLEGPAIVHTNHPLTAPVLPHENVDVAAAVYPSSQARLLALNRLRHLLDGKEGVQRALSDTSGAPDAICKSFSVGEPTQTAFSFFSSVARWRLHSPSGVPPRMPTMTMPRGTRSCVMRMSSLLTGTSGIFSETRGKLVCPILAFVRSKFIAVIAEGFAHYFGRLFHYVHRPVVINGLDAVETLASAVDVDGIVKR